MTRTSIDLSNMETYEAGATLFAHLVSKPDATPEDIDLDVSILAHYALKQIQDFEPDAAERLNLLPKYAFHASPRMEGRLKDLLPEIDTALRMAHIGHKPLRNAAQTRVRCSRHSKEPDD